MQNKFNVAKKIIELRDEGLSYTKIAAAIGRSAQFVKRVCCGETVGVFERTKAKRCKECGSVTKKIECLVCKHNVRRRKRIENKDSARQWFEQIKPKLEEANKARREGWLRLWESQNPAVAQIRRNLLTAQKKGKKHG